DPDLARRARSRALPRDVSDAARRPHRLVLVPRLSAQRRLPALEPDRGGCRPLAAAPRACGRAVARSFRRIPIDASGRERNGKWRLMSPKIFDLAGTKVYVAGHRGMVGSAIVRALAHADCEIITAAHERVDLERQSEAEHWLTAVKPDVVVVAAARVGGIHA